MTSERFPRPVVCAWCGNRHRSIVPHDDVHNTHLKQGDACAGTVYQVTEKTKEFARDPERSWLHAEEIAQIEACRIGEWLAQGHYGSSDYDCRLFRFVQNPPTSPANPVCDNCIGERIVAGDLEPIEGDFP